jgi:hypothetical protein
MSTEVLIPPRCESAVPDGTKVASVAGQPSRYGLTETDFHALVTLMRQLSGNWVCNSMRDEGGGVHACITRHGDWDPYRQDYLVARQGGMLRLMLTRLPYDRRMLGGYETMEDLAQALGRAIGWRRS